MLRRRTEAMGDATPEPCRRREQVVLDGRGNVVWEQPQEATDMDHPTREECADRIHKMANWHTETDMLYVAARYLRADADLAERLDAVTAERDALADQARALATVVGDRTAERDALTAGLPVRVGRCWCGSCEHGKWVGDDIGELEPWDPHDDCPVDYEGWAFSEDVIMSMRSPRGRRMWCPWCGWRLDEDGTAHAQTPDEALRKERDALAEQVASCRKALEWLISEGFYMRPRFDGKPGFLPIIMQEPAVGSDADLALRRLAESAEVHVKHLTGETEEAGE